MLTTEREGIVWSKQLEAMTDSFMEWDVLNGVSGFSVGPFAPEGSVIQGEYAIRVVDLFCK